MDPMTPRSTDSTDNDRRSAYEQRRAEYLERQRRTAPSPWVV